MDHKPVLRASEKQGTTTNSKDSRGKRSARSSSSSRESRERLKVITPKLKVCRGAVKVQDQAQTTSRIEIKSLTRVRVGSRPNQADLSQSSPSLGQTRGYQRFLKGLNLLLRITLSKEEEGKASKARSSQEFLEVKAYSRLLTLLASSQSEQMTKFKILMMNMTIFSRVFNKKCEVPDKYLLRILLRHL